MPDQYKIDAFSAAELARVRKKVDSISGPGVTNGPDFVMVGGADRSNGSPGIGKKGSLPKGQYQGMVCTMRTNNSIGFDFPQFVPPLGS